MKLPLTEALLADYHGLPGQNEWRLHAEKIERALIDITFDRDRLIQAVHRLQEDLQVVARHRDEYRERAYRAEVIGDPLPVVCKNYLREHPDIEVCWNCGHKPEAHHD
jgi:hypothetical protein